MPSRATLIQIAGAALVVVGVSIAAGFWFGVWGAVSAVSFLSGVAALIFGLSEED